MSDDIKPDDALAAEVAKRVADAMWERVGPQIRQRVELALMDRLLRHVANGSAYSLDSKLAEMLDRRVNEILMSPVVDSIIDYVARRRAADRVKIKLDRAKIDLRLLTDEQKAWLKKNGYDVGDEGPLSTT